MAKADCLIYSESVSDNVLRVFLRPLVEKELNNEVKWNASRICWVMRFKEVIVPLYLSAALLVSCEKNSEIKVYRVSKAPLEESAPQQQDAMPTNTAAPRMPGSLASAADTSVPTPPNWEPQPLSQMRQASFLVKGDNDAVADISFVSLGSAAGNVLENVNRWLGQLGQAPITEQKLGETSQRLHTSLGDVTVVDLTGLPDNADPARDGRIIAAVVTTADSTLFFKMRGNADLTEAQKSDFIKWVAAVCNAQMQTGRPQMATAPPQASNAPQIKWKRPETWTEVPPSTMRYASFSAPSEEGGKIDISVVTFPGDGGTDADNVNRWRGQIGLAPIDANTVTSQIAPLKTEDTTFSTTDIAGDKTRTIAAWTRRDGSVWFFKATGPNTAVEKEKSNFVKFIESIRF